MLNTSQRINEDLDFNDNIRGTYSILKFMKTHYIEDLIFASSSSIYGNTQEIPTPESASCPKPLSIYGASKLSSEALISSFCNNFPMRSWMFRFSNVTGNRKRHGVIYDTVNKLMKDPKHLPVLGNGTNIRSYIDVQDVINALLTIPPTHPLPLQSDSSTLVYNIGNLDTLSIKQVINIICDELSLKPSITYTNTSWHGDLPRCIIDSAKALQTGWSPSFSSEECIRREVRSLLGVTVL
jgi:UDP-glucose 4-epimerase